MVINSQRFPALLEPKPLWGGLGVGWAGSGAGYCPPLSRGWNPDCRHQGKPQPAHTWGKQGQRRFVMSDLLKATSWPAMEPRQ